jgi:preprotein translocase subunit SecA
MHVVLSPQTEEDLFGYDELPEMQAHHLDPQTGEDDFVTEVTLSDGDEAPASRQARRAAAKQANGAGRGAAAKAQAQTNGAGREAASGDRSQRLNKARAATAAGAVNPRDPATWGKVSRNAACPCGSGKKYKHCHGAIATAEQV